MERDETLQRLQRQLMRKVQQTCKAYGLLAPDDRILVAISGGKDSYTMLELLHALAERLPFSIELVAVHLDQQQPGYDGRPLIEWLNTRGHRYEILSEDTYSVVTSHLDENSTYCSLCARLRRGILYTAAERLKCNKIALGHHREDTIETLLMNLFYAGKLQAMPAAYTTDDGRFQVIRPLIECAEDQIAQFATLARFPILPCNLCGSQSGLKREAMAHLLTQLETDHPHLRSTMLNALRNVRPSHLLDRDVQAVWADRPEAVRPITSTSPRRRHAAAEPVSSSKGRLPILVD
ncbi:MAG: tRNA 2-thiocytidine(32) synthetase TtcA [Myxococcota bacterium]